MIYPCAIFFPKPPLHFNFSLLQGKLLIAQTQAQAHAMALTHSTVIANDDITVSIVIGIDTGTVIQDSKFNEDAQARESKINYELDINNDPVDCNCVIVNDAILISEAEMEVEIAAIETQRHRAMTKCRLAQAWSDRDCGFHSPTTMISPHAKTDNRQRDSTTAMTGAFAIDRAAYL